MRSCCLRGSAGPHLGLLVPARLAAARDAAVHDVIGHQEEGLQLQQHDPNPAWNGCRRRQDIPRPRRRPRAVAGMAFRAWRLWRWRLLTHSMHQPRALALKIWSSDSSCKAQPWNGWGEPFSTVAWGLQLQLEDHLSICLPATCVPTLLLQPHTSAPLMLARTSYTAMPRFSLPPGTL